MKTRQLQSLGKRNLLPVLTLLLVLVVLSCFAAGKEGYHMDELLSFELSNAEFNPWIVPTQPVGRLAKFVQEEIRGESLGETLRNLVDTGMDVLRNRGGSRIVQYKADVYPEPVWISGEQFRDYVTTGKEDRFNYLSVYFNVKDDNHPPLHFMFLHTMSSLFPGVIAPFLGCAVNILAVLGCVVCFFYLGSLLEAHGFLTAGAGEIVGACAGVLYGISSGGIATVLLIRMYGLVTFFCVALFCLHLKKWLEGGFGEGNKALGAVTVLGFLTQYFFLFYCFVLAAVTAGLLIKRKRFSEFWRYLRTMVLAAVAGVAVFPFALSDVFSSGRGVEALKNMTGGFEGYGTRLWEFGGILMRRCFGSTAAGVCVLVCLLAVWCARRFRKGKRARYSADSVGSLLLLILPVICYFLLAAKASPYLVDRYIMPLFPFTAMLLALGLWAVFSPLFKGRRFLVLVPALLLGVFQAVSYDGAYLYRGYERQLAAAEQYRELPCICLYDGSGFYENLLEFTRYERTLLLKLPELERRQDMSGLSEPERMVLVKKSVVDGGSALELLADWGWEVERELVAEEDSVYGDTVYLLRKAGPGGI